MANKMLIDATHPEETRVTVVRGNRVEEFDFEAANRKQLRGNIYLAKVTRVEPSLQAAFVEYGGNRHGFLAFSEIHPDYYQLPKADREALERQLAEEAAAHQRDRERREQEEAKRAAARRSEDDDTVISEDIDEDDESSEDDDLSSLDAPVDEDGFEEITPGDDEDDDNSNEVSSSEAVTARKSGNDEDDDTDGDSDDSEETSEDDASDDNDSEDDEDGDDSSDDDEDSDEEETSASDDQDNQSGRRRRGRGSRRRPRRKRNNNDENENRATADSDDVSDTGGDDDDFEGVPERARRLRDKYKIQEVIKRRQLLLVQVVKEERGNKGAALTTYLSLAGRYSVLMPNTDRGGGISRKITKPTDRKRLKEIAHDLGVPEGMGVILRTAGASRTKAEIRRDFEYLMRLWENVRELTLTTTAPNLVYEEGSLIKRSIRDLYNKDIDQVLVSGDEAYREAKNFMRMLMPSHSKNVQPYRDPVPIFNRFGVEAQLDAMFSPEVTLKSGGYIVINQTEALVSIDVNSGKATREQNIEDTALATNMEAAEEIARQLRLRDLAGLVVIDFIDMEEGRNNRAVERKLKECLKADRARIQVGRISHFGLLEMSRQRLRTGVLESSSVVCPHCRGSGIVRSVESLSLHILRSVEEQLMRNASHDLIVRTPTEVALYVLNQKRDHLIAYEQRFGARVIIQADDTIDGEHFSVDRGEPVSLTPRLQAVPVSAQPDSMPSVDEFEEDDVVESEADEVEANEDDNEQAEEKSGRRRRRRRRRRNRDDEQDTIAASQDNGDTDTDASENGEADGDGSADAETQETSSDDKSEQEDDRRRRRRRGRRGGRRSRRNNRREQGDDEAVAASADAQDENASGANDANVEAEATTAEADQQASTDPNLSATQAGETDGETSKVDARPDSDEAKSDDIAADAEADHGQEAQVAHSTALDRPAPVQIIEIKEPEVHLPATTEQPVATETAKAADADQVEAGPVSSEDTPVSSQEPLAVEPAAATESNDQTGSQADKPEPVAQASQAADEDQSIAAAAPGTDTTGDVNEDVTSKEASSPEPAGNGAIEPKADEDTTEEEVKTPSEPVVTSETVKADQSIEVNNDAPRRTGWWQRRSFF